MTNEEEEEEEKKTARILNEIDDSAHRARERTMGTLVNI